MPYSDPEKDAQYHAEYRQKHREQNISYLKEWRKNNPEKRRAGEIKQKEKLRQDTLTAYGHRCSCCGETRPEFLSIDHINGLGYKPKNKHGQRITGHTFYRWLRQQGFPKDNYRLLCHNCNQALGYHGYCPHEFEGVVLGL